MMINKMLRIFGNRLIFKILQQYIEMYLKVDVLLLLDVFEHFRTVYIKTYELDSLHYFTIPGLAFDSMLKITQVQLELLTNINMIMFIECGIRGNILQCSNRYGKGNNKYMGQSYNPDVPSSYLMYYDVNNLYGTSMYLPLPYSNFDWVDPYSVDILKIDSISFIYMRNIKNTVMSRAFNATNIQINKS